MRYAWNIPMIRFGILHALGGSLLFISMMPFFLPFVIPNIWEEIAKPTKKKSLFGSSSKKQRQSPIIVDHHKEDERAVLRSIWKRATKSRSECDALSHHDHHTQNTNNNTRVKNDLPSGGVANAIKQWRKKHSRAATKNNRRAKATQYPVCKMPPPKLCHIKAFTVIIMAHNTDRFEKLTVALTNIFPKWQADGMLTEIILVWNSKRSELYTSSMNSTNIKSMLEWHIDPIHPFRIFYALEHGLTNNLLNRYHPLLAPKNDCLVYFDDDGPFYTTNKDLMKSGFELWKRNSNVQVGSYGRQLTFTSDRINTHLDRIQQRRMDVQAAGTAGIIRDNDATIEHDKFVPICEQDEAKYEGFSDFGASIILPTGSIIHRNYLCFIWHPAFEEMRQFVQDHITHPDDMMVTILIAQLSGQASLIYPRKEYHGKKSNRTISNSTASVHDDTTNHTQQSLDYNHRRLLWEMAHWFEYRQEAINAILRYFGSIPPLS